VETTGEAVALRLVPDRASLAGDRGDAQPITVQAVDAQGRPVPTAGNLVNFEIAGPGAIIGVGNGDPLCHEPEKASRRSLYNGLGMVLVQSAGHGQGPIVLKAAAEGLKAAELSIGLK
jgi:beta-galactosidase